MSIPMERMTPEEIDRLRMRHTNRDGTAEVLCSKAWAHIQLLEKEARFTAISVLPEKDAEIERLRAALNAISCSVYGVDTMQSIARAALEEKP